MNFRHILIGIISLTSVVIACGKKDSESASSLQGTAVQDPRTEKMRDELQFAMRGLWSNGNRLGYDFVMINVFKDRDNSSFLQLKFSPNNAKNPADETRRKFKSPKLECEVISAELNSDAAEKKVLSFDLTKADHEKVEIPVMDSSTSNKLMFRKPSLNWVKKTGIMNSFGTISSEGLQRGDFSTKDYLFFNEVDPTESLPGRTGSGLKIIGERVIVANSSGVDTSDLAKRYAKGENGEFVSAYLSCRLTK